MSPGGQVDVTVSPTAVPLTVAITPLPIPGSPQPPSGTKQLQSLTELNK